MGVPAYLAGLNLDPGTAARLASMAGDPPPPPFGTMSGSGDQVATRDPGYSRVPAGPPSPEATEAPPPAGPAAPVTKAGGLNWSRAGDRVKSAADALETGADYVIPGHAISRMAGKKAGDLITGKAAPASEDTGEGITPEMVENRNRVAAGRRGEAPDAEEEGGGGTEGRSEGSPGHYVGATWVPGTRSSTVQHGIDESKLEPGQRLRLAGMQHGEASIEATQQAAAHEAAGDVAYAEAHAQATQEAAARQQRIENEKQAYTIREHEKLDALNTAAQQQVDPEAAKGSMGSQILAALAVGLGQFGASLNGGTNTALQIVNGNIDRRIAAQQFNINNAHKALSNEQSLYKDNLAAFGDKERAAAATKMQYIDQAKAQLDQVYAAAKSGRNEAQYHAMREGLDEKYAAAADQFGIRTADQVATSGNEHYAPAHMEGGSAGGGKPLDNVITLSDGTHVRMPDEKQADKARDKIVVISQLQDMATRALKIRKKLETLNPVTDRTAYETEHKTLEDMEQEKIALLSTERGQGTVRDNEYARAMSTQSFFTTGLGIKGMIDPRAAGDRKAADANLKRQIERGDNEQRIIAKGNGGTIVKQGFARDPGGNLVHVGVETGQELRPDEKLPPRGFRPMNPTLEAPTAGRSLSETTERAPDFGYAPAGAGGGGGGKGGKGPTVKRRK